MFEKLKSWLVNFEKTKTGQQIFRFVRLSVVTVAIGLLAGTPATWAAFVALLVGAVETAFRQVFQAPQT